MILTMVVSEVRIHDSYHPGAMASSIPINYEVKISNGSNELSLIVDASELEEYRLGSVVEVEVTVK